jgi:hypothetical protein
MAVKTARVSGRRQLHFHSYQDMLDDVHALAAAPCRQLGNWSLGQICCHLAQTMHMSIDGAQGRFPWYLRLVGPLLKKRFLSRPMQPGFVVPPTIAPQLLPGDHDTAAGVAEFEKAIARLDRTAERKPHGVFGPMSREEWDQLHMRHGEMHLSFIMPAAG